VDFRRQRRLKRQNICSWRAVSSPFYVVSITYVAPRFGLGNAIFFVLLGQLLSAAVIDHFGLFNAAETRLNVMRVAGLLVMAGGVWLTQVASAK
jgi:transporter family-2 protein